MNMVLTIDQHGNLILEHPRGDLMLSPQEALELSSFLARSHPRLVEAASSFDCPECGGRQKSVKDCLKER